MTAAFLFWVEMPTARQVRHLKKGFLEEFARHGNISEAAREVGIDRTTVYLWKQRDAAFLEAFERAELDATEVLETEARRRAVEGWEEPVFGSLGQGAGSGEIGTVRKFSDTLLIFLLKGRAPEKYRDRASLEHTGKNGGPIVAAVGNVDLSKLTDEELNALGGLVEKASNVH